MGLAREGRQAACSLTLIRVRMSSVESPPRLMPHICSGRAPPDMTRLASFLLSCSPPAPSSSASSFATLPAMITVAILV